LRESGKITKVGLVAHKPTNMSFVVVTVSHDGVPSQA
jgi:hypothetical protein